MARSANMAIQRGLIAVGMALRAAPLAALFALGPGMDAGHATDILSSGVVVDAQGEILTNAHVVENGAQIQASGAPTRVEQESQAAAPAGTNSSAPNASDRNMPAPAASTIPQCDKPGGMGLARIVEIDTTGGPGFGFQHFKQYDFLHDKEVVLTFDDGPWPSTPAVLKAPVRRHAADWLLAPSWAIRARQ